MVFKLKYSLFLHLLLLKRIDISISLYQEKKNIFMYQVNQFVLPEVAVHMLLLLQGSG